MGKSHYTTKVATIDVVSISGKTVEFLATFTDGRTLRQKLQKGDSMMLGHSIDVNVTGDDMTTKIGLILALCGYQQT